VNRILQTFLLAVIAVSLALIATRPMTAPEIAHAANGRVDVFMEPGTTILRAPDGSQQVNGKVVIDLHTGDVWGYPTFSSQPYPIDNTKTTPPVSRPFLLGKFDFSQLNR